MAKFVTPEALKSVASNRDTLPTSEAAPATNRQPQTLINWACMESTPIRPVLIDGRLAWRVADSAALLNGGAA